MKPLQIKSGLLIISGILAVAGCRRDDGLVYKDPSRPVERRVEDLLKRMTIEEKVGQMCQYVGLAHMRETKVELTEEEMKKSHAMGFYADFSPETLEQMTKEGIIGSFLHVLDVAEANHLQSLAAQSRLGIPLIIGIDAMHGTALVNGATVYPTAIGQASSFNPELVEKLNRETALEMRATGAQWTFGPNIEVARDARWGRTGDTYGEDPYLVSILGVAATRGLQGTDFSQPSNVIACAKHMAGGSQPLNGINGAPADFSERTLWEVFLPPFKAAVDAGIFTVMAAHNEYNGVPCHGSRYLLTEILRERWGFDGFVVSDWMDIERMEDYHRVGETLQDVYEMTLNAGMDMHMHGPDYYYEVLDMVRTGRISEKRVDASVRKILEAKFRLGLFENPMVDEASQKEVLFNKDHRNTALQAAREGIVLLKNDGLLPLDGAKYRNIFVTGTNADNQTILGDWALRQPEGNVTTIYEGIRKRATGASVTLYPMSLDVNELTTAQIREAAEAASRNDLAVIAVGENSLRYHWDIKTCGENSDRYDINLYGLQEQLVEEIHKTGTPVVVVLVSGRPLATEWISDNVPALVNSWEPGSFGGQALAEILFGDVNPSAKLPVTIPRHSGQIQTYYNYRFTSKWFDYATGKSDPLYHFGYGLSYTTFEYGEPVLSDSSIPADGTVKVSVNVTNTGGMEGTEIVQLYIRDEYSSVTRPVKELKDFARVTLKPNETKQVDFNVTPDKLAFYDINMDYRVEPGDFTLMVGGSSRDEDLKTAVFRVN